MNRRTLEAAAQRAGVSINIERLGRNEIHIHIDAPQGQRFSGTGGHMLVTHFYSDAPLGIEEAYRDLLAQLPMEPCDAICAWEHE